MMCIRNWDRTAQVWAGVFFFITVSLVLAGCSDSDIKTAGNGIKNSLGMEFVRIPAGSFIMGEATRDECGTCNASEDETPRHPVRISRPFYMGRYEVTQKQWLKLMKDNPSRFKGKNKPVENVSWENAMLFIEALNRAESGTLYRLPTEAEWEHAARAGTATAFSFGDKKRNLLKYGWYISNSGGRLQKVGKLRPNPWGLYDMHGNVFEWCSDWYSKKYYRSSPETDPRGPSSGAERVRRGGSWDSSPRRCRSSARESFSPNSTSGNIGFRLVREIR